MTDSSSSFPTSLKRSRRLESLVRKAILKYKLVDDVAHVAVALSGGKDSLSLLLMLHAIQGKGIPPLTLSAIHVQGEFSCGAQVNRTRLASICNALNIPLIIKTSTQTAEGLNCYSCSRERRRLLFHTAKEIGCSTIAFGHHRDDLVQTTLMNLLHKGQFEGLLPKVPMILYGITTIRPLILAPEKEIIAFAQENGFQRLTCQCPFGQTSMRKKTEQLVQLLEEVYPNTRINLARAVDQYGSQKALTINKVRQEEIDTFS